MVVALMMVSAVIVGVFAARLEEGGAPRTRAAWVRLLGYWLCTVPVAFEMAAGGVWDLLRIEYVRVVLTHLGYPLYLLDIIGVPRIPCAFVLLAPRFRRLKEWAYAGAFFDYGGAAASHLLAGDHAMDWAVPMVLAALTLGSWALRPAGRILRDPSPKSFPDSSPATPIRRWAWAVPILVGFAMLAAAFATLPKGAPPQ